MNDKDILRQLTREIMGSSVAHMNDAQLDAWSERIKLPEALDSLPSDYPAWFIKRRDEARSRLLGLLLHKMECSVGRRN
jgi:hypothetical protein